MEVIRAIGNLGEDLGGFASGIFLLEIILGMILIIFRSIRKIRGEIFIGDIVARNCCIFTTKI